MSIRSKAKLLLDTIELRAGSIITSVEVRALKWRWRRRYMQRMGIDIEAEIDSVFCDEEGEQRHYQIDKALTESGLAWWRANLLRKDGTMRNNAWTQGQELCYEGSAVTARGGRVLRILNGFEHFMLEGWHVDYNHFGDPCASFPVFGMHGAGDQFTYIARPWQSGGRTEIV